MKKLDVILRTCQQSLLSKNPMRICGDNREDMVIRCLSSLVNSINRIEFDVTLTVLDDRSDKEFVGKIQHIMSMCCKPTKFVALDETGFNNSAYQQFLMASQCDDMVYSVEDDYLHEPDAIKTMLEAYNHLYHRFKTDVVLYPFDCPLRYQEGKEEPTMLLYDNVRYWRQCTKTANTIFTHSSVIRDNFSQFSKLALEYPKVLEDDTINLIYKRFPDCQESVWCFSPIPSVAYHLSYQNDINTIRTNHLSWQNLWNNDSRFDLIDGWFNYRTFYQTISPSLSNNAIVVEVGSWLGKSTIGMATMNQRMNKNIRIYAIDTWQGSDEKDHHDKISSMNKNNTSPYDQFINNIRCFDISKSIIPVRKTSVQAARQFKDNSLDLVIIDASHEHDDVVIDINTWLPKVKKGGILAGDDYSPSWLGVVDAVNETFGKDGFQLMDSTWYKIIS